MFENPKGTPRYISRDAEHGEGTHNGGFVKEVTKTGERLDTYAFDHGKFVYLKR